MLLYLLPFNIPPVALHWAVSDMWQLLHLRVFATVLQGLYSLTGKTSYHKISWSLEAARFGFKLFQSLWNLAGTSAALLPRCLSNFRAIRPLQHPISRLRDFTRFGGKTSYRLVNRGPWTCIVIIQQNAICILTTGHEGRLRRASYCFLYMSPSRYTHSWSIYM